MALLYSVCFSFLYSGSLLRSRRPARIQTADAAHQQVYNIALQSLQGRLGLAYPAVGHIHCYIHPLLGSLSPQRQGGAETARVWLLLQPFECGRLDCGYYVHHRYSNQLQNYIR